MEGIFEGSESILKLLVLLKRELAILIHCRRRFKTHDWALTFSESGSGSRRQPKRILNSSHKQYGIYSYIRNNFLWKKTPKDCWSNSPSSERRTEGPQARGQERLGHKVSVRPWLPQGPTVPREVKTQSCPLRCKWLETPIRSPNFWHMYLRDEPPKHLR